MASQDVRSLLPTDGPMHGPWGGSGRRLRETSTATSWVLKLQAGIWSCYAEVNPHITTTEGWLYGGILWGGVGGVVGGRLTLSPLEKGNGNYP